MALKRSRKGNVVVFGVFDLLHKGHLSLFRQAGKHGKVIAIVARDRSVLEIKKKRPHHGEKTRVAAVRKAPSISKAILGDTIRGSYKVLKKIKPIFICLGYDQQELEKDIRRRMKREELPRMKILRLKAHKPKEFKTSIVARSFKKKIIQSKA